jgi:hypothetical protein
VILRQLLEQLAVEREGEVRVGGIRIHHVAPVAAAALKQCEVPFEAEGGWPIFRRLAHVPLAGHVGVIARIAHHARDARHVIVQVSLVPRLALLVRTKELRHVAKAGDVVVGSAQQHRTRRRTSRADVKAREAFTRQSQPIQIRRLDLAAEGADVGVTHVVRDDDQDVRSLRLPVCRRSDPAQQHAGFKIKTSWSG